MPPRKKVSQQRLARELHVSQALVSLALNGRKDGINPDTYQRIWAHALSLGYQPKGMNFAHSPVEASAAQQVAFILRAGLSIHTQGSYFSHVLHGLHTGLAGRGHTTAFLGSEDALTPERLTHFFRPQSAPRGVVLFGEVSADFLKAVRAVERRVVAVSARYPGLCHSVIGNEPHALLSLVQHLHALGHRRIGWLGGNVGLGRHEARYGAFRAALVHFGLTENERYRVTLHQGDRAAGTQAILSLLPFAKRRDFPTAFIAFNTQMAAGAVMALTRERWVIPGDCSLAGADFSQLAQSETQRITVAGTDPESLGLAAARLVLEATGKANETMQDLILPSQFAPGDTTGPVKI